MFPLCMTVWVEMGNCICSINDQVSIKISYLHSQLPNQGLHVSVLLHLSRAFGYFSLSQYANVLFPDQRWKKHMYLLLWVFLSASWVPKPKPTPYWRSWIFIYLKPLLSEWSRGSVQFSLSVVSDSLQSHGLQHTMQNDFCDERWHFTGLERPTKIQNFLLFTFSGTVFMLGEKNVYMQ